MTVRPFEEYEGYPIENAPTLRLNNHMTFKPIALSPDCRDPKNFEKASLKTEGSFYIKRDALQPDSQAVFDQIVGMAQAQPNNVITQEEEK